MISAKKAEKKEEGIKEGISPAPSSREKYIQAIGRRKLSVARVRLFEGVKTKEGKNDPEITINQKSYKDYFSLSELRDIVSSPLKATLSDGISKITVVAKGGGMRGQAESARLGIARCLVARNIELKKTLKDLEYLTRDARTVERKKAGLKKARRAPQFSKR